MQTLSITRILLTPTPAGNTICTVHYEKSSDPGNWILVTNSLSVPSNGFLPVPLTVSGIPDGDSVTVRAEANCGGTPYEEVLDPLTTTTTTTTTAGTTTTTTAATTTTTTTLSATKTINNLSSSTLTFTIDGVVKVITAGSSDTFVFTENCNCKAVIAGGLPDTIVWDFLDSIGGIQETITSLTNEVFQKTNIAGFASVDVSLTP